MLSPSELLAYILEGKNRVKKAMLSHARDTDR